MTSSIVETLHDVGYVVELGQLTKLDKGLLKKELKEGRAALRIVPWAGGMVNKPHWISLTNHGEAKLEAENARTRLWKALDSL